MTLEVCSEHGDIQCGRHHITFSGFLYVSLSCMIAAGGRKYLPAEEEIEDVPHENDQAIIIQRTVVPIPQTIIQPSRVQIRENCLVAAVEVLLNTVAHEQAYIPLTECFPILLPKLCAHVISHRIGGQTLTPEAVCSRSRCLPICMG